MTDFFNYAVLCINKTQQRNESKAVFSSSSWKVLFESVRTTEAYLLLL